MISVCMSTYNGEKYIYKQLQSIYEQIYKIDEVIICDDCSNDNTVKIIAQFICDNDLKNWKLYCNEKNKGYPQNFYYAMQFCTGDIVFLADQDDVWVKDKIANMMSIMDENVHIKLLASKWGIIDEQDNIVKEVVRGKLRGGKDCQRVTLHDILYYYNWPGMSMCYRKEFGEEVLLRSKASNIPHDMALGIMATEIDGFYCSNSKNQYHRRHANNVSVEEFSISKMLKKERKLREIRQYIAMLQEILRCDCLRKMENINKLETKKIIMEERLSNLQKKSRGRMLKQYFKYFGDIRLATVICDWIIM